ncbi:MAG TPA: hypothetical protein VIN08_25110 [Ohtaekwangia sp.]|uniref:hypothetical protein n=1 Tax=Ohtaekwangia sp. TaxID=2066019 RepID=UPI002F94A16C
MQEITPLQYKGKAIDAHSSRLFGSLQEAKIFFKTAKERLQSIHSWHTIARNLSATFRLVDASGIDLYRAPREGDYFKIDIPGPGSIEGEGYDWVKIEAVESNAADENENYSFRVRPAGNPQTASGNTAHFYSPDSTSTFIVSRWRNKVIAAIHDRNIEPNKDADSAIDKLRDRVIGTAGVISFSKIQWQGLTDGIVA